MVLHDGMRNFSPFIHELGSGQQARLDWGAVESTCRYRAREGEMIALGYRSYNRTPKSMLPLHSNACLVHSSTSSYCNKAQSFGGGKWTLFNRLDPFAPNLLMQYEKNAQFPFGRAILYHPRAAWFTCATEVSPFS